MVNQFQSDDWREIKPPLMGLYSLFTLVWIFFAIFSFLDFNRLIYLLSMILVSCIVTYQLFYTRSTGMVYQTGGIVFFVILWLGMVSFTLSDLTTTFPDFYLISEFTFNIKAIQFIAVLPLVLVWIFQREVDSFFGIKALPQSERKNNVWRYSVLILILLNIINLTLTELWGITEYLILIPLIAESVILAKSSQKELPILTLRIQEELTQKFAVPLSLLKSISLIMIFFTFELISSRFWLLVILAYFAVGLLWIIYYILPKSEISQNQQEKKAKSSKQIKTKKSKNTSKSPNIIKKDDLIEDNQTNQLILAKEKENKIVKVESTLENVETESGEISTVSQKAHSLGKKVREGIEKPFYTLNHILATLTSEDFSIGYRVNKNNLKFQSLDGEWSPPKGLVIFPIHLEKYDFRRSGQILLLGFNQPIEKRSKMHFEVDTKRYSVKMSKNSIKFGNITFNPRSLIVSEDEFENNIKLNLEVIDNNTDISYTGFKNLAHMQDILSSMADKWIELRITAQEAAVNFLAGLLGATDPVFVPKEGYSLPQTKPVHQLKEQKTYIDVEAKEND
jgi:hypothetical protein